MLAKRPGVNFINILRAAFALIFFFNPNCNWRKASKNTFVQKCLSKMLMKLTLTVVLLCLLLGATFGQILSESLTANAIDTSKMIDTAKKSEKQKGDISTTTETDQLTAAS